MTERCPVKDLRSAEPSLHELLSDPVARLLMARDGTSAENVRKLFEEMRRRLFGASLRLD